MNYWKPLGITAICVAAGLAWLLYDQSRQTTDSNLTAQAGSSKNNPASRNAGNTGKPPQQSSARKSGGSRNGRGGGRPPALVVTQPVAEARINDRLKAVGSGMAKASVSVVPFSSGLLDEVLVTSGQRVEKNTVIARLDNEEQQIARDRAARLVENAAVEEARIAQLFRTNTTSESELIRARAALTDARLALRDAELTLARREVKAPIAGIVGLIAVDEGNYISPQTEIVTIDDRSAIVLEFWIPERFSNQIASGQEIEATSQANPEVVHNGTIIGIGSRIESDSRTLPVQAELRNNDDSLRPGMAFNINLSFTGQSFPAVDPLAIQWDSRGSFVWAMADSKVNRVPVQIIQRNPESVLVAGELAVGAAVVTEGLLSLRPGASVRVQGGSRAESKKNKSDKKQRNSPAAGDGENSRTTKKGSGAEQGAGEKKAQI